MQKRNICACGSYAINPHLHGRDPADDAQTECDVCYWRNKYEKLLKQLQALPQNKD